MSIDYKFSNLFGTVYSQGELVFTPDGRSVLSPVGNRVSCYDVVDGRSFTFSYEHRRPVQALAINASSTLMLSIDETGRGILVNFALKTVLHHMNFKERVTTASFSPDGQFIAVATGRHTQLWRTPTAVEERQFAPFVRHRVYTGHFGTVTSVQWSQDSRFFLTASKDMTAHIYSVHAADAVAAASLSGHRDAVIGAYFSADQETIYTLSKDGAQFEWKWSDEKDKWAITNKNYFSQHGSVTCSAFHSRSQLLVVGYAGGLFALYELPTGNQIQTLTISQDSVDYVTINSTGEWLLFGAAELGQLLVWEWQSESYILKQQSHYDSLNAIAYSPDGSKIVTGSDDGKIKVWDAVSGFAVVTFSQHVAAVTALEFSQRGNVLFSASLDGSVRAWDLLRYRNFRTFTAAKRVQFTSLGVDPSGELVCAGSLDDFDIHVWNVQSSQLVDTLSGHEGPVSDLTFSPDGSLLASGSWDHSARLWSFFGRTPLSEPMMTQSEVLSITFRPDGKVLAVSSMDGLISLWNVKSGQQEGEIDGKLDIGGHGRHLGDRFAAKNAARGKNFTNIAFSLDGTMVLAGGNSRYICLYDAAHAVLLKRFEVSKNMALDGTLDKLNSSNMTEAGALDLIDHDEVDDEAGRGVVDSRTRKRWQAEKDSLPGAQKGAMSKTRPAVRTRGVQFSPTSASFSAASTEGLLVYSVDQSVQFDPFDLDVDITVESCMTLLKQRKYLMAVVMAFRLGEARVLGDVVEAVPSEDIALVSAGLPSLYVGRLLEFISARGRSSPHIEFYLIWLRNTLEAHGPYLAANRQALNAQMRAAQRFLVEARPIMEKAQENVYTGLAYEAKLRNVNSQADSDVMAD